MLPIRQLTVKCADSSDEPHHRYAFPSFYDRNITGRLVASTLSTEYHTNAGLFL